MTGRRPTSTINAVGLTLSGERQGGWLIGPQAGNDSLLHPSQGPATMHGNTFPEPITPAVFKQEKKPIPLKPYPLGPRHKSLTNVLPLLPLGPKLLKIETFF